MENSKNVMVSAADESVVRIMPLGDSITAGYYVGNGGYRDHLRGLLRKNGLHVDFVGRNVDMSNGIADPEHEGYSGATIDQIAQKAGEALPQFKPDIVLLFAGTNDIRVNGANDQPSNPVYWKDAPKRFEKLLGIIKRQSPQAIIFVGTLMPYVEAWAAREDAALEYNAKLAEIVSKEKAQGTKIYLVDFRKTVDAADLADGLHPNAKGYEKMAQAWAEAMTAILRVIGKMTDDETSLEGTFGKAAVNVKAPGITGLWLRAADGQLEEQSLLSKLGVTPYAIAFMHSEAAPKPWARGACTYVVAEDGTRHESRNAPPDKVERSEDGKVVRLMGITLAAAGRPPVAVEDWTLSTTADGAELAWEIERRWLVEFKSVLSGSPGLFFGFHPKHLENAVACTMWYDPERLAEQPAGYYEIGKPSAFAKPRAVVTTDRNPWAVYKLWTTWPSTMDLRLQVEGGHLYKRGHLSVIGEAGAVTGLDVPRMHRTGEVERIVLRIGAADKRATGHQLEITLPDHETERTFKNFYGSLLNGGSMADPKRLFNGNGCDSFECPVTLLWQGIALSAGVPVPGELSARPVAPAAAFRRQLEQLLGEANADGLFPSHYGGDSNGIFAPELGLYPLIGAASYVLHSGDAEFARQHLPTLERLPRYMLDRRDCRGLFGMDRPYLWYYDALPCSGVTTYHNALLYRALRDLAMVECAVGNTAKAAEYEAAAASLKAAINTYLWREDAVGGPRYVDFVDRTGRDITFFCDLCQWLPIAVGIASPEQARKVVATADARIKELEKSHGYPGSACLSALWPYNWPDCGKDDIEFGGDPAINQGRSYGKFGNYMYGGMLLTQTYWEVVARARAGDANGAWNRLRRFARQARINGWSGDNAANIRGEMTAGDGEAYLADMVVVPAALIHGILGVEMDWDSLTAHPCLPHGWDSIEAEILHKGRRYRVTAQADGTSCKRKMKGGNFKITKMK